MNDLIYGIDEIKRIVAPIASKYDVDRVFLFGSYARGDANSDSDIDFVIDKGRLRGLQLASMLGDSQERFEKSIDLLTLTGISNGTINGKPSFKYSVEKDMVVIYEQ